MDDQTQAAQNSIARMSARFFNVLGSLMVLFLLPCSWSQTRPHPAEPQLDTTKPFVIRETYQQAQPSHPKASAGIVGLDMLITPGQYPLVQAVLDGTPAFRQGVQPGDRIVAINGVPAIDKSRSEVDALISDVPGDPVSLKLLRGTRLIAIQLTVVSLAQVSRNLQNSYHFLFHSD